MGFAVLTPSRATPTDLFSWLRLVLARLGAAHGLPQILRPLLAYDLLNEPSERACKVFKLGVQKLGFCRMKSVV